MKIFFNKKNMFFFLFKTLCMRDLEKKIHIYYIYCFTSFKQKYRY